MQFLNKTINGIKYSLPTDLYRSIFLRFKIVEQLDNGILLDTFDFGTCTIPDTTVEDFTILINNRDEKAIDLALKHGIDKNFIKKW